MSDYPFLLALVEGPSEAKSEGDDGGVVRAIIHHVFGPEVARSIKVDYWRHMQRSPLRAEVRSSSRRVAQIVQAIKMADVTTAYGAVILVDNDHHYEGSEPARLIELREGVAASVAPDRAAIGVAREMIEAWLLADPGLARRHYVL